MPAVLDVCAVRAVRGARKVGLELHPVGRVLSPGKLRGAERSRWRQESVQVREGRGYSANKYANDYLISTVTSTPKMGTSRHESTQLGLGDRLEDIVFRLESQCRARPGQVKRRKRAEVKAAACAQALRLERDAWESAAL